MLTRRPSVLDVISRGHCQPRFIIPMRTARRRMGLALIAATVFALAITCVAVPLAFAHAAYVSSDPQPDAVLTTAPGTIRIHFAEPLNPSGSDIIVYDAHHEQVSTAPAQVDRADLKTMSVPIRGDDSETYLVEWHTVSATDGDPDIGAFTFTVNASATGTQESSPASAATTTGNDSSRGGTPGWLIAVAGIVGLVIGAVAMHLIRRGTR